jgi:hypothetical protein
MIWVERGRRRAPPASMVIALTSLLDREGGYM